MSIIIRKRETGDVFDIPTNFKLEIKNTSPLFNDLGSKTITTTLPKTSKNIRLLNFSNRIDLKDKPRIKMAVTVISGSYVREGMLYLSSAYNTENTFGITIAFNEGIMYESMSDILLNELSGLPIEKKTIDEFVDEFNGLLNGNDMENPLSVFHIWLKKSIYTTESDTESDSAESINDFYHKSDHDVELQIRTTTAVMHDGKPVEIAVPYGYGISPFVKVWYVLESIFSHYGYKVNKNPFKEDYQLKRLCVLNNLVGSIMEGILDYKQLLPKVSIMTFLQSLYTRFGLKIFFDSNSNQIDMVLLKDIFRDNNNDHIVPVSLIDIDYTTARQLRLSASKNLDNSNCEYDSYEEFLANYNNTIGTYPGMDGLVKAGGVYYSNKSGVYYRLSTNNKQIKIISSVHFDWNKNEEGLEIEEITSADECITMVEGVNPSTPYFAVDPDFSNLVLEVDGELSNGGKNDTLAFAFDMGGTYLDDASVLSFSFGSIFPYSIGFDNKTYLRKDKDGNEMQYALTFVGEYGAFNQFFKEYDAFLRHSNKLVKFKMQASPFKLSNVNFQKKIILENQLLLLDKVDHDLDDASVITPVVEARTVKLYEPYDLDKEHYLPIPGDILYCWVLKDTRSEDISNDRKSLQETFPDKNPNYIFGSLSEGEIIEDEDSPDKTTFWFLPPSAEQFNNEIKIGTRKHTCKVKYIHRYLWNIGSSATPKYEERSEFYERYVSYTSSFYPEEIA